MIGTASNRFSLKNSRCSAIRRHGRVAHSSARTSSQTRHPGLLTHPRTSLSASSGRSIALLRVGRSCSSLQPASSCFTCGGQPGNTTASSSSGFASQRRFRIWRSSSGRRPPTTRVSTNRARLGSGFVTRPRESGRNTSRQIRSGTSAIARALGLDLRGHRETQRGSNWTCTPSERGFHSEAQNAEKCRILTQRCLIVLLQFCSSSTSHI